MVINDTSFKMDQEQLSQEFQLSGATDRLDWLLGAYYFHEEGDLIDYPIFGGGLVQIFGPNELENDAYAAFAHLNFRLSDRWV